MLTVIAQAIDSSFYSKETPQNSCMPQFQIVLLILFLKSLSNLSFMYLFQTFIWWLLCSGDTEVSRALYWLSRSFESGRETT